jgi:predicted kinase
LFVIRLLIFTKYEQRTTFMIQTLLLFKGLMGTGKSTLSQAVGKRMGWPVINIDDIADVFVSRQLSDRQPASYDIMFSLGKSLLEQNFSVILESSLRGEEGFERSKQLAKAMNAQLRVIECFCSDDALWRQRLETRPLRPNQLIRDWHSFLEYKEKALPDFAYKIDCPVLTVDTARDLETITDEVVTWLKEVN